MTIGCAGAEDAVVLAKSCDSRYSYAMASEHDLMLLVNVGNNGEASVLRSYLEHHGIHVYIKGENHRSLLGMVGTYIDLGVMVPNFQLEDAQDLTLALAVLRLLQAI